MLSRISAENWVERSKQENVLLFSELEVLLRGIDRFFTIENHQSSGEDINARNFFEELLTIRDGILRILSILEVIIPESRKNAYWFQKYTETKFLPEQTIDAVRQDLYRQDTPEKGLYLLYDSFINLKGIITDLLRAGTISYLGFSNIGHLVSKEIRENRFFNPFVKHLHPEFDVISNAEISGIVRSIADRDKRKNVSVIFLSLFRILRMLSFVEITTRRSVSLNSSLLIIMLVRSEITALRNYVEKAMKKLGNEDLKTILQSISYQFSMETKRVYAQELKDILRKKASAQFRGKIENSHGILKNLAEQSIVQIAQHYEPGLPGEEIFVSFTTRVEQSLRLREDVVALHRFLTLIETVAGKPSARLSLFDSLRSYMLYFESFTFRLLRHDDYEEFSRFFREISSLRKDDLSGQRFTKILERIRHFRIFLETTLRHLGNRAELAERPVDDERVERLVGQYL